MKGGRGQAVTRHSKFYYNQKQRKSCSLSRSSINCQPLKQDSHKLYRLIMDTLTIRVKIKNVRGSGQVKKTFDFRWTSPTGKGLRNTDLAQKKQHRNHSERQKRNTKHYQLPPSHLQTQYNAEKQNRELSSSRCIAPIDLSGMSVHTQGRM